MLRSLLHQWDVALTPILGDPQGVATDLTSPARTKLAAAFTPDSPYVSTLTQMLEELYVKQDHGVRPGKRAAVQTTTLLRISQVRDANHVSFVFCSFNDGVGFTLSTGKVRPFTIGVTQGTGDAVRAAGVWRLDQLQQLTAVTYPAGTPNPCPGLASR
jgi:hypothetical protein